MGNCFFGKVPSGGVADSWVLLRMASILGVFYLGCLLLCGFSNGEVLLVIFDVGVMIVFVICIYKCSGLMRCGQVVSEVGDGGGV